MKRGILLLTLMALLGLTSTAWAGPPPSFKKAPRADAFIKKAAKCPGGDCGKNCRLKSWLNANVAKRKIIGKSDCFGYVGDSTMLNNCKKAVAAIPEEFICKGAVAAKAPCPLLGRKIPKKQVTPGKCACPRGTHVKDGRCECDEDELAGIFVTDAKKVDSVCMTKAERLAAAEKRRKEKERLAALQRKKEREAYEATKEWNAWHQARLHPDEDGFGDECPDSTEKVACDVAGYPEVCLCRNCWSNLSDELTPSDPWVLKAGEREECPSWFAYLLEAIGWVGVIGIPILLLVLAAIIFFFATRKKDDDDKGPDAPDGDDPDGEVSPLPPVDAASFEALEAKMLDKLTSSEEGGFLHPDHPFMKGVVGAIGAAMVSRTEFDEALENPPEPLLEAVSAAIREDLVREQTRTVFSDIIAKHRVQVESLGAEIDKMKAQDSDPGQLQALEIQLRVHETCLSEAEERDRLLAGLDEDG